MPTASLAIDTSSDSEVTVTLGGEWLLGNDLPGPDAILDRLRHVPKPDHVSFDTSGLGDWDTGLITTVIHIAQSAEANGVTVDQAGLPEGARKLIELAFAVKEREGARRTAGESSFLSQVGDATLDIWTECADMVAFVGETVQSVGRLLKGKARYLRSDQVLQVPRLGHRASTPRRWRR